MKFLRKKNFFVKTPEFCEAQLFRKNKEKKTLWNFWNTYTNRYKLKKMEVPKMKQRICYWCSRGFKIKLSSNYLSINFIAPMYGGNQSHHYKTLRICLQIKSPILWYELGIIHKGSQSRELEAALRSCSHEKVFWKYVANLQENTHTEVRFQ